MPETITVFDRDISVTRESDMDALVSSMAAQPYQSAFFCNVHMLMLSQEDPVLARAMDNADRVFADSAPIAWLQRRASGEGAKVIPGYKVMLAICDHAARNGDKIGFFGSTPNVINQLVDSLSTRFNGLSVAYKYSPPFMQGELVLREDELKALKESGIQWLFVGLGCPKQEKWVNTYGKELGCHTLAVGAAFDWLSGSTKKPPDWMERFGLAWVYRLFNNPRKMWSRYLIYNTKFLVKAGGFLIRGR